MIFLKKKNSILNFLLIVLSLLMILIASFYISEKNINNNFSFSPIGEWKGSNNNFTMILNYSENNNCSIYFISNATSELLENEISGICEINFQKSPTLLSIRTIQELTHPLFTVVQIINNKTIKISSFSDKWRLRPLLFEDKNSIILNKI